MSDALVIGTRGSALALWQARRMQERLGGIERCVRLEIIRTRGDARLDLSLSEGALDKGAFTKELEQALLDGRIDLAVHSLKDLPTSLPEGLELASVPERADCSDLLLVREDAVDEDPARALPLKRGALVGTGSPRRAALLRHACPDAGTPALFRGNVDTRIARCMEGSVDAVILARAGVARLELDPSPLIAFDLDPLAWIPAPAQGALGLELRAGDPRVRSRIEALADPEASVCTSVERRLLARLEAGCHAALGAYCPSPRRLLAGRLGEDGRWRSVELHGATDTLVDAAAAALDAAPPAEPFPSLASPARRWWP